jgi:hypothetical protein
VAAALAIVAAAPACADHAPTGMTLTALAVSAGSSCYSTLAPGDPLPVGFTPAGKSCGVDTSSAPLAGGVDTVRLVIGYGDLEFEQSTAAPTPTVSMTLDGKDTPPNASIVRVQDASPTVFEATFVAPAQTAQVMMLGARVTDGFDRVIGPFAVSEPDLAVVVQECAGMKSCVLAAGVGFATVQVTVPGSAATSGAITSTLGGVAQPTSVPLMLAPAPSQSNTMVGTATVPVPAARAAQVWVLTTTVGGRAGPAAAITLGAPTITATLSACDVKKPCSLAAGTTVDLFVSAPRAIQMAQAAVTTRIDGTTDQALTLPLEAADVAMDTISGSLPLKVPDHAGSMWVVDARVEGYAAGSVPVTITPAM